MKRRMTRIGLAALAATLLLAAPGVADHNDKHRPKGGSEDDGDGKTPAVITLRDCQDGFPSAAFANLHPDQALGDLCPVQDDRVQSDTQQPYEDGVQGVEAFLGSKANFGNVWLKLANSPRGLFLDFTDCAAQPCNPPFGTATISESAIKVEANRVLKDGLFALGVGESLATPLRIFYQPEGAEGPGFVDFDANLKGKNPCKDKSNYVTATRTGESTWEIVADPNTIGCVTRPDGDFGGTYRMPFQFTVQVQ